MHQGLFLVSFLKASMCTNTFQMYCKCLVFTDRLKPLYFHISSMVTVMTLTQGSCYFDPRQWICEPLQTAPVPTPSGSEQPRFCMISEPAGTLSHFLQTFKLTNRCASGDGFVCHGGRCTGFSMAGVLAQCPASPQSD